MEAEKLIKMANQIGDFYEAEPNVEDAKRGIAKHLVSFWNSIMIKSIIKHVNEHQGQGLHPCVLAAIKEHIV